LNFTYYIYPSKDDKNNAKNDSSNGSKPIICSKYK